MLEFDDYISGIDKDLTSVSFASISKEVHTRAKVNELVATQLATFREVFNDDPDGLREANQEPFVASRQFCGVIQKQMGEARFVEVENIAFRKWLSTLESQDVVNPDQYRSLQSLSSARGVMLDLDRIHALEQRVTNNKKETVAHLYAQLKVAVLSNDSDKVVDLSDLLLKEGEPEDKIMSWVRALDFRKSKTTGPSEAAEKSDDDEDPKAQSKRLKKTFHKAVNAVKAANAIKAVTASGGAKRWKKAALASLAVAAIDGTKS